MRLTLSVLERGRRGAGGALATAITPLLLAAACSGGGGSHPSASTLAPATTTSTVPLSPTAVAVNKTINFEEFTVVIATADPHGGGGTLKMLARVTNTLTSPQEFNPNFVVTSAGKTYDGQALKNPTVSPNGTVSVELDAPIDSTFTMSDAMVVFGNNTKNQAVVPLGTQGLFTPLLDIALANPGPVTAGLQEFTFTSTTLSAFRYDGSQMDAGTWELRFALTVKNNDPNNTFPVTSANFKFVNGGETLTSATIRDSSANAGGSVNNLRLYADVDNYKAGTIALTLTGADAQQNSVSEKVTIPLPALQ